MAQDEMLLFHGRNRIRYGYARWGYTRGGGSIFHAGADVEGLDDTTIRMPGYGLGAERHAISGTVVTARRVAQSTGNPCLLYTSTGRSKQGKDGSCAEGSQY